MPAHVATAKQLFVDREDSQFANGGRSQPLDGITFQVVIVGKRGSMYLAPIVGGVARFTGSMMIPFAEAEAFFKAGLNFVQTEKVKAEHVAAQSEKNK